MKNKTRKIKLSKIWQKIFSNKPLIFIVAILILAIVFTNKNISQYFKPKGSQAASGWTITNITSGWSGVERVQDASGRKIVFTKQSSTNYRNATDIYLYDIVSKNSPTLIKHLPIPTQGWGENVARIDGNKIAWAQLISDQIADVDIYTYNIDTPQIPPIKLPLGLGAHYLIDIWQNKVLYIDSISGGYDAKMINLANNVITPLAFLSWSSFPGEGRFESNRIAWTQRRYGDPLNKNDLFVYDFGTGKVTKVTTDDSPDIVSFDLFNNKIVAHARGPLVQNNIFAYDITTKVITQLTNNSFNNMRPAIWKNMVAYHYVDASTKEIRWLDITNPAAYQSVGPVSDIGDSPLHLAVSSYNSYPTGLFITWSNQESNTQGDVFVATRL